VESRSTGEGLSSPVIQGERIWATAEGPAQKTLNLFCLSRKSGELLYDVVVAQMPAERGALHQKNSLASPTPVIEGDRVYVHFGFYGTACLNMDGQLLWKVTLAVVIRGDQRHRTQQITISIHVRTVMNKSHRRGTSLDIGGSTAVDPPSPFGSVVYVG
jgi:hypothetical protein